MTSSEILFGLGLVLVLAVGSQLLARRLRVPAIVVLLPAGFIAGIATSDVNPENLLGSLYQPFVSLAVGVILFEAGLGLSLREAPERVRPVVSRLVAVGIVVTCLGVAGTVSLLFDVSTGVAFVMGAILVVSGPTVVLPLLAFIRPARQVRSALTWEGVLVDPVGAIFGVLVFHAVSTGAGVGDWHPGVFLSSVAVGAAVGVAGAVVLWALLREIHRNEPRMAVLATLMVVIAAVVASDLIRDDAGLVAATVMGVALGNQHLLKAQHRIDVSLAREFHETLVQLLIGVLFVMIAASVTPGEVRSVLADALALVAVMVLILRPLTVALATWRSGFTARERGFMAWMAPRGIVAGATASAFGLALQADGVAGSAAVLPTVFIVIFATVVLYGLTAPLVARRLGVAEKQRRVVLIVGGHEWARELALALARSGVAVRMWVGRPDDRAAAQAAGLEADQGCMVVDAVSREA
ncbi:MAG TPA: cation:proton antiporter, partial [Miltoncostaeaceae bacterium]|nr:cation:proton antiporter [Miltoncostaeaceae bacterium]